MACLHGWGAIGGESCDGGWVEGNKSQNMVVARGEVIWGQLPISHKADDYYHYPVTVTHYYYDYSFNHLHLNSLSTAHSVCSGLGTCTTTSIRVTARLRKATRQPSL